MINVMLVDDEYLSRQNLSILLNDQDDIGEILEASDGKQAVELFYDRKPDVVFLDIEMPCLSGIDVAREIGKQCTVIFVTAYDQYAVSAFELNAIDYLLKPYDDDRFFESLARARSHNQGDRPMDYEALGKLFDAMMEERGARYKSQLVIKDTRRIRLVPVEEVNFVLGCGNYVEIYMKDESHILHRETMASIEKQLDPKDFVRIHRSSIVRVSFIRELLLNERGDYRVRLKNDVELTVSRANKYKLMQFIN